MKDAKEIIVKILIFLLVILLLTLELLKINVQTWEIIIKVLVLVLTLGIIVVEVKKAANRKRMCHAFIYKDEERGIIYYCDTDQGDHPPGYRKLGDGQMPCDLVVHCAFR